MQRPFRRLNMSSAALVSLEEYLHRTEKPYCEYVDGVLHPKPMPTKAHAFIQYMLLVSLRRQGIEALSEVTVRLSATKFLIPDVIAAHTYHEWGVPFCWVIDAQKQKAWQYHAGGEPERVERGGVLRAGELNVRLEELFSETEA